MYIQVAHFAIVGILKENLNYYTLTIKTCLMVDVDMGQKVKRLMEGLLADVLIVTSRDLIISEVSSVSVVGED